jgi:hypothetical protein
MSDKNIPFPTQIDLARLESVQSHGLRTPFNQITGFSKMLLNTVGDAPLTDIFGPLRATRSRRRPAGAGGADALSPNGKASIIRVRPFPGFITKIPQGFIKPCGICQLQNTNNELRIKFYFFSSSVLTSPLPPSSSPETPRSPLPVSFHPVRASLGIEVPGWVER